MLFGMLVPCRATTESLGNDLFYDRLQDLSCRRIIGTLLMDNDVTRTVVSFLTLFPVNSNRGQVSPFCRQRVKLGKKKLQSTPPRTDCEPCNSGGLCKFKGFEKIGRLVVGLE
jgi:hypothetical protein